MFPAIHGIVHQTAAAQPVPAPGEAIITAFRADMSAQNAITIVAYGDSWTHGLSHAAFPFAERLAWDIELLNPNAVFANEGMGGWDSSQGLANLANVTAHAPDYCILNFGINDWGHSNGNERTPAEYTANMGQIIDDLAAAGCETILWVSGPVKSTSGSDYGCGGTVIDDSSETYKFIDYVNALKALAVSKDVPIIDVRQALIDHHNNVASICDWFWNPIHLNQRGHNFMHRQFRAALLDDISVLLHDTFDGVTGTRLAAHAPAPVDNGQAWIEHAGTWEIQGNVAKKTATDGQHEVASIETGAADAVLEFALTRGVTFPAQPGGPAFRVVDNNNFWGVFINGTNLQLFERTAGTFTRRTEITGLPTSGNDSWQLYIKLIGPNIEVRAVRNETQTYTLSFTSAQHQAATRHGLWGFQVGHEFRGIRVDGAVTP